MATSLSPALPAQVLQPWGALLELVYSRAGLSVPSLQKITDEEIPQPYRRLLVHSRDLTPTLEEFYKGKLGLTVLNRWREGQRYLREVVLDLADSGKPVGYGVICVELGHLPPATAHRVLQEQAPFGSILQAQAIPHLSWPQAFFRAEPDSHMRRLLKTPAARWLYGRRNVLLDGGRRLLAEVLEVLAPNPSERTCAETPRPHRGGNGAL